MTSFSDRQRAAEAKHALDDEARFKALVTRNRAVGEWASRRMGLSEADTQEYAASIARLAASGHEATMTKLETDLGDLASRQDIEDALLRLYPKPDA